MAQVYRSKVRDLAKGLERAESRTEAREALRCLVDAIVLTPAAGRNELAIGSGSSTILKTPLSNGTPGAPHSTGALGVWG
jgi:hypothetical protein